MSSTRPSLPRHVHLAMLATDVILSLLGLAVWFGAFPPGTPIVDALPPIAGLFVAVLAALGAATIWFMFGRNRDDRERNSGAVQ